MLAEGQTLADRYVLRRQLAAGGMSDVWQATDEVLDRPVAVKIIRPELMREPGSVERFAAEARILAGLRHPGIVGVHDYGEIDDPAGPSAFLVMEFIDGEPLSQRLAREHQLSDAVTMDIVAQAADAVHTAHLAGVVHRDIKPANLLVCPDGTVVVVDFGIAKAQLSAGLTQTDTVLGTARYMAPEQVTGGPVAPTTDVYALGAVAYECLTGMPPFDADNPVAIAFQQVHEQPKPLPRTVGVSTRAVVERAMAKDSALRFADAAAMAAAARTAAEPTSAPGSDSAGSTVAVPAAVITGSRRRLGGRYLSILGASIAAAVAAALIGSALASEDPPSERPGPSVSSPPVSGPSTRPATPAGPPVIAPVSPDGSTSGGTSSTTPAVSGQPQTTSSPKPQPASPSPQSQATTPGTGVGGSPSAAASAGSTGTID